MIRCFCHPAIEKLLAQSRVKTKYLRHLVGTTFISSCLPQATNFSYGGLLQAVKFRLANPSYNPIIILSFHSRVKLMPQDTYGILSLHGTEYLQLPVSTDILYTAIENCIEKYHDVELLIPNVEWKKFSIPAYKDILKRKLSEFKHGNLHDFVNNVTGPLRAACVTSLSFPKMLPQIKGLLEKVQEFIEKEEISELMILANKTNDTEDSFLLTTANFSEQLAQLAGCSCHTDVDTKQLIFIIDNLNETYSKLQAM